MPRPAVAAALVAAALTLSACTPAGPATPTTAPSTASGDVDLTATTGWAGSVCTALTDVSSAVDGIGEGLTIDPLAGVEALDDARLQIGNQIDAVGAAVGDLRTAIAAAPDAPGDQAIRSALDGALGDLDAAQQDAVAQAQAAAGAGSVPEFLLAAGGALVAVRTAAGAVGDLYSAATGSASGASEEVRAAFAQAPACQALQG